MATTHRNSWRRQDDYRSAYARNHGRENYNDRDFDGNYSDYTDTNFEDEEDRERRDDRPLL